MEGDKGGVVRPGPLPHRPPHAASFPPLSTKTHPGSPRARPRRPVTPWCPEAAQEGFSRMPMGWGGTWEPPPLRPAWGRISQAPSAGGQVPRGCFGRGAGSGSVCCVTPAAGRARGGSFGGGRRGDGWQSWDGRSLLAPQAPFVRRPRPRASSWQLLAPATPSRQRRIRHQGLTHTRSWGAGAGPVVSQTPQFWGLPPPPPLQIPEGSTSPHLSPPPEATVRGWRVPGQCGGAPSDSLSPSSPPPPPGELPGAPPPPPRPGHQRPRPRRQDLGAHGGEPHRAGRPQRGETPLKGLGGSGALGPPLLPTSLLRVFPPPPQR